MLMICLLNNYFDLCGGCKFQLINFFLHLRCPDKRSKRSAPLNFAARQAAKSVFPRFGGPDGGKLDRKLLYSRFRPVKSFRAGGEDRENNIFTCTAFSGDRQFILAGTSMGDLKMFNILSGEVNILSGEVLTSVIMVCPCGNFYDKWVC